MKPTTSSDAGPLATETAARWHKTALKLALSEFEHLETWEKVASRYRARPDGGPTIRVFEGTAAEKALMAAGFRFVPQEKGFRA